MADAKKPAPKKKLVVKKKSETVRQRADKSEAKASKNPRTRKVAGVAMKPVKGARSVLSKEYNPIKTPDTKTGRVLGTRWSIIPPYFKESYRELKLVTWPTKKTAAKLTIAVFIFSVALMLMVLAIDFVFEWLFRDVILA